MSLRLPRLACLLLCLAAWFAVAEPARTEALQPDGASARQSLDDAWWTGPMLAAAAGALPPGHMLIEPYVFDVHSKTSNSYGSLTYINYGLVDRLTVGMMPTFGYNQVKGGPSSGSLGFGDLTLLAQYGLTKFQPGHWTPTTSLVLEETLPTGKFDRLGARPSDGLGSGAYATTLGFYAQTYAWMPNGRILRMRLDLTEALSGQARLRDVSVYGTSAGFRGHAQPGAAFVADASWEYSLTRSWVLALDANYRHAEATSVVGYDALASSPAPGVRLHSPAVDTIAFAPALEYSWRSDIGVLLAARIIPAWRNVPASITPAIAVNYVY